MDAELWSLRNKVEDVLEALQKGDLASAHMAATQAVTALNGLIRKPATAVTVEAMNEPIAHPGTRTMRMAEDKLAEALIVLRDTYGADTPVWLFGSRADDSKRGGDVDLFVQSENRDLMTKIRCRRRLMETFDLKVDLIVGLGDTPIQRIAVKTGVRIN